MIIVLFLPSSSSRWPSLFVSLNRITHKWDMPRITGRPRLIGSPKLHIIFHKRATKYRSFLRKTTNKDKGSYESSTPYIMSCGDKSRVVVDYKDQSRHICTTLSQWTSLSYTDESWHISMSYRIYAWVTSHMHHIVTVAVVIGVVGVKVLPVPRRGRRVWPIFARL